MLRVLTLSTLFPNAAQPTLGVFVERQALALAALPDVEVEVVSAVGLPPWPFSLHPHFRTRSRLPREEDWKGLTVHRPRFHALPQLADARSARAMAKALLPLLKRIRARFPFDVIDAEFFWPDGPAAMLLARSLGVPFTVKARGADIHYWSKRDGIGDQLRRAAEAASGLMAVSEALKSDMVALGMPEEKIAVHYTGVDHRRFRPQDRQAAKQALGLEGPVIFTPGALIPRKGQRHVIEALPLIPGANLLLVGSGPDREELERLARHHRVSRQVRFLGSRLHRELPQFYAAADVTVLPSASEGLANVWVESLACGTPLVITAAGGAREVLDRPEAGRIVLRDHAAIAEGVRDILADPPAQAEVAKSADRFSWEANAAALRSILSEAAGR